MNTDSSLNDWYVPHLLITAPGWCMLVDWLVEVKITSGSVGFKTFACALAE